MANGAASIRSRSIARRPLAPPFIAPSWRAKPSKLGYRIEVTGANGAWELEGYSREQVMAFSQRRQEIEQQMAAAGLSGPKAAQIATLNSRQAKGTYDEAALKAEWKDRAIAYGIDAQAHFGMALGRGNGHQRNDADAQSAVAFARTHTTEREAVIDRRTLEAAALQHAMGRADLDGVRQAIAADEQRHTLIRAGKPDWQQPQGAFTTDEMLALERAQSRDGAGGHRSGAAGGRG